MCRRLWNYLMKFYLNLLYFLHLHLHPIYESPCGRFPLSFRITRVSAHSLNTTDLLDTLYAWDLT